MHSPSALCFAVLQGSNSVCNSYIPVVSPASSVSVSLALFNSVGNLVRGVRIGFVRNKKDRLTSAQLCCRWPPLPLNLSLYHATVLLICCRCCAMQGGILGPWLTGVLVEATGQYDSAMTVLGLVMLLAAAMAWSTRTWEGVNPKSPLKQDPSIVNSRSVGVGVGELQGLLARNNEND